MGKVGMQGFNNKDFLLGIKDSTRWKKINETIRTNYVEVACYEVPQDKDESTFTDVARTGITQRNTLKIVSARGYGITFRQLLCENYMNCFKDVIKTSLGDVVLPVDGNGDYKETRLNAVICSIKPSASLKVGAKPFYLRLLKAGRVVYSAESIPTITSTKSDIVEDICLKMEALDVTNNWITIVQTNSLGATDASGEYFKIYIEVSGVGRFDSYECSDNLTIGCLLNVNSVNDILDSSFVNDKTPYFAIIKDEDSSEVVDIIAINKKVINGAVEQLTVAGDLFEKFVKYETGTLRVQMISFVDFDKSTNHVVDYMLLRSASYLPNELNEYRAGGASIVTAINSIGSAKIELPIKEQPMIEVEAKADSYEYVKPMDDDFIDATTQWKEATREGSVQMPRVAYPAEFAGTSTPTWEMRFGSSNGTTTLKDDYFGVYVNGEEFKVKVTTPGTTAISAVLVALAALINATTDYGSSAALNVLTVTAVNKSANFHCEGFVLETSAVATATSVISSQTVEPNSQEYNETSKFVSFEKFLIGDAYCNMFDFCEVGKVSFEITRKIVDISSVCGEQGRKGMDNSEYTIYLTLDVTDVQAVRVHDKWDKFINNKDFMILACDIKSGISFFFPKCRMEEHVNAAQDTLQGHQYKINVNYDPNKKFAFALPQILLQTTPTP